MEQNAVVRDNNLSTWWFAGLLLGAVRIAQDKTYSDTARRLMCEVAVDLTEHWEFDDRECRRIER